jgi:sugar lactone lactonase YvrE
MPSKSALQIPARSFSNLLLAALAVCAFPAAVQAQTATFTGTEAVAYSSQTLTPYGIALDGSGNLYIADAANNQVLRVPAGGGQPTTLGIGLNFPSGVAVDSIGDVYIADTNNNRVVEVQAVSALLFPIPVAMGLNHPAAVAVDASGNVFIADTGNNRVVEVPKNGMQTVLGSGFNQPTGLAIDSFGNLHVADSGNNRIALVPWKSYSFGAPETELGGLNSPTSIAFGSSHNLYIAENNGSQVLESAPSASGGYNTPIAVSGSFEDARAVAVGPHGALYVGDTGTQEVLSTLPPSPSVDFGSANVCTVGQAQPAPCSKTVNLNFQVSGIGSDTPGFTALTLGAQNLDFKVDPVGTSCANDGNGFACSANVVFAPLYAGSRRGALNLYDASNGNVLTTVLLYGAGAGSQANFSFGKPIPLPSLNGLPIGVAVDGADDLYVADGECSAFPCLYEIMAGSGQVNLINDAFYNDSSNQPSPSGVALDGAGNVYVAATVNGPYIIEIVAATGTLNPLAPGTTGIGFSAVAVDGAGDIFAAPSCPIFEPGSVWKVPAGSSQQVLVNAVVDGKTLSCPGGLALDAAGNLYIADTGNGRVIEVPANGGEATKVGAGFSSPGGVAVDGAGNLFVADTGNNRLAEVPAGTDQVISLVNGSTLGAPPYAVAVDGQGDVFVTGYVFSKNDSVTSFVSELPRLQVPSITWSQPHPIYFGSALRTTELNASVQSGIKGQIVYEPRAGTVLSVGTHILKATFTPTDLKKYSISTATVTLVVLPALAAGTAMPTFTPAPGEYTTAQKVEILDATDGAEIYYTTDGSTPTPSSTPYAGAISVSQSETLQAVAIAPNYALSPIASGAYTIRNQILRQTATPTFTPAPGRYTVAQSVTLVDATAGAQIYYTTDGTTPTASSTPYTGAILLSHDTLVQAIAIAPDYTVSQVASADYTFPFLQE